MGGRGEIDRAGLLGGLRMPVNNCQQCRKQPFRGARSLLGGLGDGLGRGKKVFG